MSPRPPSPLRFRKGRNRLAARAWRFHPAYVGEQVSRPRWLFAMAVIETGRRHTASALIGG
jgi:hypothetical protein